MGECPICEVHRADPVSQDTCDCGYGIEKKEIVDKSKLQNWINSLERNGKWAKVVKVKESVHEAQKKKYSRWSIDDTAALLGESKSNTSDDLGLAKALAVHPELAECKKKTQAKIRKKRLENGFGRAENAQGLQDERALTFFISEHWDQTSLGEEWEIREIFYDTKSVGSIDLLAHHKKEKKYLVIELKLRRSSDDAIGQILRYMGWVKLTIGEEEGKEVEGLVIAEDIDKNTFCALLCTRKIALKLFTIQNNSLHLEDYDANAIKENIYLERLKSELAVQGMSVNDLSHMLEKKTC